MARDTTEGQERSNPYVGFRPFFSSDALYFFGRAEQTRDLLDLLRAQRYVPVLGSSGSGKSSLVLAGVIPTLQGGFMVADRDRWVIISMRPGDAPLENFARAMFKALGKPHDEEVQRVFAERMRSEGEAAVLNVLAETLGPYDNVLILADQFEEIFAFRAAAGSEDTDPPGTFVSESRAAERVRRRGDAQAFVSLLFALSKADAISSYVISTMRTDFLGDCDRFAKLPELINKAGYLVPRLTRNQLRETIEGPARLRHVRVAPRLVDFVLNDIGDRADLLPILQHAMHRTWEMWINDGQFGPLDQVHLQMAGGLQRALAQEAEALVAPFDGAMVGRLLRRLTRADQQERRVRRPTRRSDLMAVAGAAAADVHRLLDVLSAEGTNLLYASADGHPDDPRYDISHESLIRQWDRLRQCVDEERELVKWYTTLCEKAAYLRDAGEFEELSLLAMRRQKQQFERSAVNAAWARRYEEHLPATWEDVQRYLARNRRRRWKLRLLYGTAAGFAAAMIATFVWQARASAQRSAETRLLSAIARLVDTDPTYAKRLAAELPVERLDDPKVQAVLDGLEDRPSASAEFKEVLTFEPLGDGSRVALLLENNTVVIAHSDGRTGASVAFTLPSDSVASMTALGDGSLLVTSTRSHVWHVHLDSVARLHRIPFADSITNIRSTSDGRRALLMTDTLGAFVFEAEGGERVWQLSPTAIEVAVHPRDPRRVMLAVANASLDGFNLEEVDLETRARFPVLRNVRDIPAELVYSGDGSRVLLRLLEGVPSIVQTTSGKRTVPQNAESIDRAETDLLGAGFVVTFDDGRVELLDDDPATPPIPITRHDTRVIPVSMDSGAFVLTVDDHGELRVTARDNASSSVRLLGHAPNVQIIDARATASHLFTFDESGVVRTWPLPMLRAPRRAFRQARVVQGALLSPVSGDLLWRSHWDSVFTSSTASSFGEASSVQTRVSPVAISDSGSHALVCGGGECWFWDIARHQVRRTAVRPAAFTAWRQFTADGRHLFAMSDSARLRQIATAEGTVVREWANTTEAALSADGRFLFFREQGAGYVVRVDDLRSLPDRVVTEDSALVAWAPSGAVLAVMGKRASTIHRWDAAGRRIEQPVKLASPSNAFGLAVDSSGAWLAVASGTQSLSVYAVKPDSASAERLIFKLPRGDLEGMQFLPWGRDLLITMAHGASHLWSWRPRGFAEDENGERTASAAIEALLQATGIMLRPPVLNGRYVVTRRVFRPYPYVARGRNKGRTDVAVNPGRRLLSVLVTESGSYPTFSSWELGSDARRTLIASGENICISSDAIFEEVGAMLTRTGNCTQDYARISPRQSVVEMRVEQVARPAAPTVAVPSRARRTR